MLPSMQLERPEPDKEWKPSFQKKGILTLIPALRKTKELPKNTSSSRLKDLAEKNYSMKIKQSAQEKT